MRDKIKVLSPSKKNINLSCIEILINIELLSFIHKDKIDEMKKIISKKIMNVLNFFILLTKHFYHN